MSCRFVVSMWFFRRYAFVQCFFFYLPSLSLYTWRTSLVKMFRLKSTHFDMGLDVMLWLNSSPAYAIFEANTCILILTFLLFAFTSLLKSISIFTSHPASHMIIDSYCYWVFLFRKNEKRKSTIKILVNWKANNNIFESQTNIYLSSHCLSGHVQTWSMLDAIAPLSVYTATRRVTPLCWRRAAIWWRLLENLFVEISILVCRYTIHWNAFEHSIIIIMQLDRCV